ncbi:hypothetical protein D9M68_966960 [compost metagenome]
MVQRLKRGGLLGRKLYVLLDLALDAIGQIELDDVASVLEIAGIEHDLEGAAGVFGR